MKPAPLVAFALVIVAGCCNSTRSIKDKNPGAGFYVITAHTVSMQKDDYTVTYGADILNVRYADSQTSTWKPGDVPGTGLHNHSSYDNPDLSLVPQVGVLIRRCELSKDVTADGDPIIATQPTSDPCMVQIGDTLQYLVSPNVAFSSHVTFDIVSERMR